jgi:TolB-like protein/Tfp pilus assembly protein PilF
MDRAGARNARWSHCLHGFLAELKRRNVIRVAVFYLAASWLVLQVTDVLSSLLALPKAVGHFMVVLVAIGLPVALAVAWVYELTPEGLRRDTEQELDPAARKLVARKLNLITIAIALLAIAAVLVDRYLPEREAATAQGASTPPAVAGDAQKAIAVLPFVNQSSDPEQEYFSDGVAEEILNLLGRVEGLRVTSRTSAFSFKGQQVSLPEIAAKLGVGYLIEGSVRRADDRIRVSARLIDVGADRQLWSQDYERRLDDVFAIQSEVAAEVAKALKIAMGAEEFASIGRAPTGNLDAWQRFLRSRQLLRDRRTISDLQEALALAEGAIELDPDFARAHSLRALILLLRPLWGSGKIEFEMQRASGATAEQIERLEADWSEAMREASLALQLDPKLGEPHAVRALHAQARNRYAEAQKSFRWALSRAPSNPDIRNWYGSFLLDAGYVQAGLVERQRAVELDPLSPLIAWQLAYAGLVAGRADVMLESVEKAQANRWPGWQSSALFAGEALLRGDNAEAERRLIRAFPQREAQIRQSFAAVRAGRVDPATARMLATLEPYGPPGMGRFSVQVMAGDVGAALATIRSTIDPTSLRSAGYAGPVRQARGDRPGSVLRADWWLASFGRMRRDPRFGELMNDIGLVEFWRENGWPDLCAPAGQAVNCR